MSTETCSGARRATDELSDEQARENIGGTLTRYGVDLDEWPTWRIDEFCDELVRAALESGHERRLMAVIGEGATGLITRQEQQIAALTAERDRLRRYVRALKATRDTAPGDPAWGTVATEWEDVCREIARHGDLEDDHE